MVESAGLRSLTVSPYLDIAEFVTLDNLLIVFLSCLPIWEVGINESILLVGSANEMTHLKNKT